MEAPAAESLSALQKTHLENKKYYVEFDDSIKFYIDSQFNEKDEFESEKFRNLGSILYKVQSEYLSSDDISISIS